MYGEKRAKPDLYDVSTYTDQELYDILELNRPTDRELEAKILSLVNKYSRMGGNSEAADKLSQFFIDIYTHFFAMSEEEEEEEDEEEPRYGSRREGFVGKNVGDGTNVEYDTTPIRYTDVSVPGDAQLQTNTEIRRGEYRTKNGYRGKTVADSYDVSELPSWYSDPTAIVRGNTYDSGGNMNTQTQFSNFTGDTYLMSENGQVSSSRAPKITQTFDAPQVNRRGTLDITKNDRGKDASNLTKSIDYTKDTLNPLLKQTIKRVISIDSQYRENKKASSTEFTFNLSEPLKDVVSLKLYSIQIPYTWYTINSSFGGNFFYIKGNSDGIDNGNHDYKIEISSGNYTASTLQTAIQTSITKLPETYPDVSFGSTSITYDSATVKSTLNLDIKEVFGESNYYLYFPNWTTPTNTTSRLQTIAGYLGYNNQTYPGYSIYSERGHLPYKLSDNQSCTITSSNQTIHIYAYTVADPSTTDYTSATKQTYVDISITIDTGTYTRPNLVSAVNTKLTQNSQLDSTYSSMYYVDVTDSTHEGYLKSYIQMNIKLTRATMGNVDKMKTVVVFPSDTVWVGDATGLYFYQATNELSNVISETTLLQSRYTIQRSDSSYNKIQFVCTTAEYIDDSNNFTIDISGSSATGYTIDNYIDQINAAILRANTSYTSPNSYQVASDSTGTDVSKQTKMIRDSSTSNKIQFNIYINKTFTTKDYTVAFYGPNLPSFFGKSDGDSVDLWTASSFSFSGSTTENSLALTSNDYMTFTNRYTHTESGDTVPYAFTVSMVGSNEESVALASASDAKSHINERFILFTDNQSTNPLAGTVLSGTSFLSMTLTIAINKTLTYSDYRLDFSSNQMITDTENTWTNYLKWGSSYTLSDYSSTVNSNKMIYLTNNSAIADNQITIESSNNVFYLRSYSDIDGLYTSAGTYDISMSLSTGTYTVEDLYTAINTKFASNDLTKNSYISKITRNSNSYTQLRLNVQKTFKTQDYRLVFYDPYSFVSCYSGATWTGNKTVQNATWDTTVGWILGFRSQIIYYLADYSYTVSSGSTTNVISLTGDTTVSTSLYNYFLIVLDDYTQNHLNDGLVTITPQETDMDVGAYTYVCDPYSTSGSTLVAVPAKKAHDGTYANMTKNEIYSFNQKVLSKKVKEKSYSKGPFVKDIFGIIPIKTSGMSNGSTYVEFGGTLQNQERLYFGPVNIHRMTIRLLNDRGDLVDLNNSNWSFSLVCEQLYKANL